LATFPCTIRAAQKTKEFWGTHRQQDDLVSPQTKHKENTQTDGQPQTDTQTAT
jgi:hypothetical protein